MSDEKDFSAIATSGSESLLKRARTLSGGNISGQAKVVSLAELKVLMSGMLTEHGGVDESVIAEREQAVRDECQKTENDLRARIAELEAALKAAEEDKASAVSAAEAAMQQKVNDLQAILDNDDARSRAAFLEQEVVRLQGLIDRYEIGMEVVTAVEQPDLAQDTALVETLIGKSQGDLASRLRMIKDQMPASHRVVDEGLKALTEQECGTIYTVLDLVEHAVSLRQMRHELRSIDQAL